MKFIVAISALVLLATSMSPVFAQDTSIGIDVQDGDDRDKIITITNAPPGSNLQIYAPGGYNAELATR